MSKVKLVVFPGRKVDYRVSEFLGEVKELAERHKVYITDICMISRPANGVVDTNLNLEFDINELM